MLSRFEHFSSTFKSVYKCLPVSMMPGNEREDVEKGGKIILPPTALDLLTRLNIVYPMLFKLTNTNVNRSSHCGVLEFVAEEGRVYLPHWMMQNMLLRDNDPLLIEYVTLPVARFARFQPQSIDFLDISNPKAVLENVLRTFACLTTGDVLAIKYNQKIYELSVLELQPANAVSIIECDMQVDFAPPIGYTEPQRVFKKKTEEEVEPSLDDVPEEYIDRGKQLFPGSGARLDGKKKKSKNNAENANVKPTIIKRGIPDLKYKIGTIVFKRKILKPAEVETKVNEKIFNAFDGNGKTLKERFKK